MTVDSEELDVLQVVADGSSDHALGPKVDHCAQQTTRLALDLDQPPLLLVCEVISTLLPKWQQYMLAGAD